MWQLHTLETAKAHSLSLIARTKYKSEQIAIQLPQRLLQELRSLLLL